MGWDGRGWDGIGDEGRSEEGRWLWTAVLRLRIMRQATAWYSLKKKWIDVCFCMVPIRRLLLFSVFFRGKLPPSVVPVLKERNEGMMSTGGASVQSMRCSLRACVAAYLGVSM